MFSALVTADAPAAHARWGHELDLGVRTASGWIGFGLAHRSTHPSAFVVERRLGLHAVKSTIVRIRKHFQSPGPATIRGCDVADYEIDGDDVTRKVTNGGYSMTGLEVGDTTIEVTVRGVPWSFGLRDQGGCERSRPRRAHAAVHQLAGTARSRIPPDGPVDSAVTQRIRVETRLRRVPMPSAASSTVTPGQSCF